MISLKTINLNRPYYFFSDAINIKIVDPNLLSINKISYKNPDAVVYNIKYIVMESNNNQNIDTENPLCPNFTDVEAHIIEESGARYLIFALTKKNKKVLEIHRKLWNKIKKQIETINGGDSVRYKKNFLKIRSDSNDDLPLNKMLCISVLNVVARSVFQHDNKCYPQIHVHEC